MQEFLSHSPLDTEKIAERLSENLKGGSVIAFIGGLGMGKTRFTAGLAKGLGYKGDVTSPTFAIVNEYKGGRLDIWHFDMYRVSGWDDLYSTGYFDYIEAGGVTVVEWSENIYSALPSDTIFIEIQQLKDTERKIIIKGGCLDEITLY